MLFTLPDPAAASTLLFGHCHAAWSNEPGARHAKGLEMLTATGVDTGQVVEARCDATGLVTAVRFAPEALALTPEALGDAVDAALAAALDRLHPDTRMALQLAAGTVPATLSEAALRVSAAQRAAVRERLGVRAGQELVVTATGRLGMFRYRGCTSANEYLFAHLPFDTVALTALDCTEPGRGSLALAFERDLLHRGLRLIDPAADWRSAVLAATGVIGESGPVTEWAARLGIPVALTNDANHWRPEARSDVEVEYLPDTGPEDFVAAALAAHRANGPEILETILAGLTGPVPPVLDALARWWAADGTGPVGAQPLLPCPPLSKGYRPVSGWRTQLRLEGDTVTGTRYPMVGRGDWDDSTTCDVNAEANDRWLAHALTDHDRIKDPSDVDQAATAALSGSTRAVSIRVGTDEAHAVTAAGAKYRIRCTDPTGLDLAALTIAQAGGLAPRFTVTATPGEPAATIECLRPPAYTQRDATPGPAPHIGPQFSHLDTTALAAALNALGVPVHSTVSNGRASVVDLAGRLFIAALRRERAHGADTGSAGLVWDHERLARGEAALLHAHHPVLDDPHPGTPVSAASTVAAAVAHLADQAQYVLTLRSRSWSAKDTAAPAAAGLPGRRAALDHDARQIKGLAAAAERHLTADVHQHQLAAPLLPLEAPGHLIDEAAARAVLGATLAGCEPCREAWLERVGTDAATCARVVELAAAAHGDRRLLARALWTRLDPTSPHTLPALARLLAGGTDLYDAMRTWHPQLHARAAAAALHHLALRRFRDRHHPLPPIAVTHNDTGTPATETSANTDEYPGAEAALAALGITPAAPETAAAILADVALSVLAETLDAADAADRPALHRAAQTATAELATDPALAARLAARLADRCRQHLTSVAHDRDGLIVIQRREQRVEGHAVAAADAASAVNVLLRALGEPGPRVTDDRTIDSAAFKYQLSAEQLAEFYRDHAERWRKVHRHEIDLLDPVPGIEAMRHPVDESEFVTVNHGHAGEALFYAAADDCVSCCEERLFEDVTATPDAAAVMLHRTAWALGPARVRQAAAGLVPAVAAADDDRFEQPRDLAALLASVPVTALRALMRACAEQVCGPHRLAGDNR